MQTEALPTLTELISATQEISSPPLIYSRLNEAINHPRTSVNDIAKIISEDPGLTARVLKLANSPLYGPLQVDSINRAVTLIGTKEIRDIGLCLSLICSFPEVPEEDLCLHNHWRHSIACGVIAKNIAIFLHEPSVERFFVAGCLHDIGQMVLCSSVPRISRRNVEAAERQNMPLNEIEQEQFGFDHAFLGGELLRSWNIPENIAALVHYHHAPSQSRSHFYDAGIIHLADIVSQVFEYGSNTEKKVARLDRKAYAQLNISFNHSAEIIAQAEQQIDEIFSILVTDL